MNDKPNITHLAQELCRREKAKGRQLSIAMAKTSIRNLFLIVIEMVQQDHEKAAKFFDYMYKHYEKKLTKKSNPEHGG